MSSLIGQSQGQKIGWFLSNAYGRKEIAPYAGVKAFLAMEGEEEDQADLVEATELAGQTYLNSRLLI